MIIHLFKPFIGTDILDGWGPIRFHISSLGFSQLFGGKVSSFFLVTYSQAIYFLIINSLSGIFGNPLRSGPFIPLTQKYPDLHNIVLLHLSFFTGTDFDYYGVT